jgi:hypothetical protein
LWRQANLLGIQDCDFYIIVVQQTQIWTENVVTLWHHLPAFNLKNIYIKASQIYKFIINSIVEKKPYIFLWFLGNEDTRVFTN